MKKKPKKNWIIEKQDWKLWDENLTLEEAQELITLRQLRHPDEMFRITETDK